MRSSSGISWIWGGWRWSQSTPRGRFERTLYLDRGPRRDDQVDGDVVARETGRFSRRIWIGWTVVATMVFSETLRVSASSAYSRSLKPPPLPIRAPFEVDRDGAGQDQVQLRHLLEVDHLPCLSAPLIVAASRSCFLVSLAGSSSRNGCASRRRGTAITSVLPCSSASRRAWVCGASGLALIVFARFQAAWRASRSAAALGVGEVRDPLLRAREAGDTLVVHRRPHRAADGVLGSHGLNPIRLSASKTGRIACDGERDTGNGRAKHDTPIAGAADTRHRPGDLLGRAPCAGARAGPGGRGDHRGRFRGPRRASWTAPSSFASPISTR